MTKGVFLTCLLNRQGHQCLYKINSITVQYTHVFVISPSSLKVNKYSAYVSSVNLQAIISQINQHTNKTIEITFNYTGCASGF